MVTYAQIIAAINTKIETKFTDIKIEVTDKQDGLTRPSFRTSLDNINSKNFMNVAKDRDVTVRIYYIPSKKDKYRLELLDMQDELESLFLDDNTIITEDDFIIEIYESEFDVVDGVLHFYFDIMLSEEFDRTDIDENMDNLEYKQN